MIKSPTCSTGRGARTVVLPTGHGTGPEAALSVALDALRKIALGHPCDLHDLIARDAVAKIKDLIK